MNVVYKGSHCLRHDKIKSGKDGFLVKNFVFSYNSTIFAADFCTIMKKTSIFRSARLVLMALTGFFLASCGEERFHVEGSISGATDSVLYFENMSLEGPVIVDSVRLSSDGSFSFSDKCPEAPEFYRLRIAGQIINLSADSTETVSIKADYPTMATGYEVEGSDNCKRIKELSLSQIELTQKAIAVERDPNLNVSQVRDSIMALVDAYKKAVIKNYIFADPKAASSYFALFQTLGDFLIFNPRTNNDDIRVFAAVATSWDTFYPHALRGENLHNIALEGMRTQRIQQSKMAQSIDPKKVTTTGLIDFSLTDNHGNQRSLSQLNGKVVLLDFHLFAMDESPKRILMLRELYNKYHGRGLEIYQVSLDADEHFWKQKTAALPWISVRDEDGAQSSRLSIYNVRSIPEFFLIDRNNTLVSRSSQIDDLEKAIEALL